MVKNIRHIGFSIRNEEKALSFYRDLLGFKVVKKAREDENFINKILRVKNLTSTPCFLKLIWLYITGNQSGFHLYNRIGNLWFKT